MKKIKRYAGFTLICASLLGGFIFILANSMSRAQVSGNANYKNSNRRHFKENIVRMPPKKNNELVVRVKSLSNVKADSYVVTFSLTQVGKTATEVNKLMQERIDKVKKKVEVKDKHNLYVDMISFVPAYNYDVEKRVFSKRTYNEVPKGFELKKNIHIKYTDPEYLNELITICAEAEIYDLVKVDYVSSQLEEQTKQLVTKSKRILQEKLKSYQSILNVDLVNTDRDIVDGIKIVYPIEMYQTYQAFTSSSLHLKRPAHVRNAQKTTTHYYQPLVNTDFDFVTNSSIVEPVIQVMYEATMRITRQKKVVKKNPKEYYMLSPNGNLKQLELGS